MIIKCTDCALAKTRTQIVTGTGSGNIIIIGEAPGKVEDALGAPFVGQSGMLFRKLLDQSGFTFPFYLTNLIKCRPPNNRNPWKAEINKCLKNLSLELHNYTSEIIIAVGNVAASCLLTKEQSQRGTLYKVDHVLDYAPPHNLYVSRIYHPAAPLYYPQRLNILKEDLELLVRSINEVRNI